MLGSFSTRSLALPRPTVITGLLSSRMPLLPSGAEMINRDIFFEVYLEFVEFTSSLPVSFSVSRFAALPKRAGERSLLHSNYVGAHALKQNRCADFDPLQILSQTCAPGLFLILMFLAK